MWNECPEMTDPVVKRWLENDEGNIISVVTGNTKGNMRLNIDGEIRCSLDYDCFSIPCTLDVVARKTNEEIIKIVERMRQRRKALNIR